MQIETGHKKEFRTIIARSGAGKTILAYYLLKMIDKPKIVIDSCEQFNSDLELDFTQFINCFNDNDFRESFYKYKKTLVLRLGGTSLNVFFETLMKSKKFSNIVVFVDEIDIVLNSAKVNNDSGFYEFLNRGRHKDFDLITTSRNTANIPKPLIGQTDFFYFSDLIEKGAINFVDETLQGLEIKELLDELETYQFLKVDVNKKELSKFKTSMEWEKLF